MERAPITGIEMRVGIIRGPYLNKWEMQSYEPLTQYFDVIAYHSNNNIFNTNNINIKKRKLRSFNGIFPFLNVSFYNYMFGLEKELKNVDIAQTVETYQGFSYQAIKAKKRYGTKITVTQWENIPFLGEESYVTRKIKTNVRLKADMFFAVTEMAKEALLLEGVSAEKIRVIPAGVDGEIFKPAQKNEKYLYSLGLTREDFIVLFVGRLVWEKGVIDLIYAAKKILHDKDLQRKNIHFLFIGDGPEKEKMHDLALSLGISNSVHIAVSYPYDVMPIIHNLADIFVLPSIPTPKWQEQFGMVLIEAMACGKPVISTFSGSIPEVVGNVGVLAQPNSPLSLYSELKKLIQNDALRYELSKAARVRVEDLFHVENIAKKIKEEYQKLLGK